jgi:hypothetical protein
MYLKKPIDEEATDAMLINLSVREKRLRPDPACDWCGDPPAVVYAASQTTAGEKVQCWRWAACSRCERMIDNGNWEAITRKVTARFKRYFTAKLELQYGSAVPDDLIQKAVQHSLKQFHDYAVLHMSPGGGKTA